MARPRKVRGRKLTRSETMARVRSKGTDAEVALRRELWRTGVRYRLHLRLPGTPDLAFPGAKIAVFIDGCFWHGCPVHYTKPGTNTQFWEEKLARNIERDDRVTRELEEAGWRVLRVWEHEVEDDAEAVAARVAKLVLASRRPPRSRRLAESET